MNHLSAVFTSDNGNKTKYQTWEVKQGAYRYAALVLRGPFIPMDKDKKFLDFLTGKYCKVYAPELHQSENRTSADIYNRGLVK